MQLETAVSLIEDAVLDRGIPQQWIDIGAGSGLFSTALSTLLPAKSSIVAIDRDETALKSIKVSPGISLNTLAQDFIATTIIGSYDGILMANALHYVPDATQFLKRLKTSIFQSGQIVIIDYERTQKNPWVPYPIGFEKLKRAAIAAGYKSITKLKEVPSVYNNGLIYSSVLRID